MLEMDRKVMLNENCLQKSSNISAVILSLFYGLLLRVKTEHAHVSLQRQFEEPSIFKTMKNKEMKLTL